MAPSMMNLNVTGQGMHFQIESQMEGTQCPSTAAVAAIRNTSLKDAPEATEIEVR
jgi:hypothetical protein